MRRLVWFAVAILTALGAASVAAGDLQPDRSASAIVAIFSAPGDAHSASTCTTADGAFQVTNGSYTGRASGDPLLSGPLKISVRVAISTTQRLGTVDGFLRVGLTQAHVTGVYRNGTVSAFLAGVAGGQRLAGTLSAGYTPDGGFTGGTIGSGGLAGIALRTGTEDCKAKKS